MAFVKLIKNWTLWSGISKSHLCSLGSNSSYHVQSYSKVFTGRARTLRSVQLLERKQQCFVQKRNARVEIPLPAPGPAFRHNENLNAVRLLKSLPEYKNLWFLPQNGEDEDFLQVQLSQTASGSRAVKVDSKWRDSVTAFIETACSSQEAKLPVTHPKNQVVLERLLKEVTQLTDDELCQVLYYMRLFAPCPSVKDPAYMFVWKELDKECQARRTRWSMDLCFVVADLWYGLNLARYSEFHWSLIKRLFRKCDKLSKEHFVRFMFCLNLNRDLPDNSSSYDLEYGLNKVCNRLTPEEVVVIGMSFFKTETLIRDPELLKKLLTIFLSKSESVDSVSVSAVAKLARYCSNYKSSQVIHDFQEKLIPELPRLNITACTHIALTGTNCLSPNKKLIQQIVNRVQENLSEARLKELERISLSMTMFNADCDQLAKLIAEELQSPERADEIRKYGRCLPAILHYLSIRNVFIPDLMSMCFSKAFRDTYYGTGRSKEILQRELLCLDVAANIELEEYNGKRLDEKSFNFIMKKNMLRIRPHKATLPKVFAYEIFLRSVTEVVQKILKDRNFYHVCAILPQHHSMAIVYCRDASGTFVRVPQYFTELESHQIKQIEKNENISYHALILCGRNMYLFQSKELSGQALLQLRQIKKLGYSTKLVYFCDWETIVDSGERLNLIKNLINSSSD